MYKYLRVLIVDNKRRNRETLKLTLKDLGISDIIGTSNTAEAWRTLCRFHQKNRSVQLIFVDISRPRSAARFIARLMNDEDLSESKIVILDSSLRSSPKKEFLKNGAVANLKVPFCIQSLRQILRRLPDLKKAL